MAYRLYFRMPIGDQDKTWAPHVICGSCQVTLEGWLRGSRKCVPFAIASVWRESKNNLYDCYFCSVDITKYRKARGRLALNYPSMPLSIATTYQEIRLIFPKLSEAKVKGGIFIGPQVRTMLHGFRSIGKHIGPPGEKSMEGI